MATLIKIRSQTKPFLYLFQLVGAKDPVHEHQLQGVGIIVQILPPFVLRW